MRQRHANGQRLLARLRGDNGIIDLASVIIGVLVLGIIASIATVSVIGLLRTSAQDSARNDVNVARTAELAARIISREFLTPSELANGGYLEAKPNVAIRTNAAKTCYVAVSVSTTGTVYYGTSQTDATRELTDLVSPGCINQLDVRDMAGGACRATLGASDQLCVRWD